MEGITNVVCPHCQTPNRIPTAKLGQNPKCGRCHSPLLTRTPLTLTGASFDRHLTRTDLPLVVDFWSQFCGHSKRMLPAFKSAAGILHPGVRLALVDTSQEQSLAGRYRIEATPTMILFQHGREKTRISGALEERAIIDWIRGHLRS